MIGTTLDIAVKILRFNLFGKSTVMGECWFSKRFIHLEPAIITWFGQGVYVGILKHLWCDHLGFSKWTLSPMTSVLLKRKDRRIRREGTLKVGAEISQASISQGMSRIAGSHLVAQIVKNLPTVCRLGFNSWSGRFPGEGKGYPLQYSCLENPMERGAWWATVYGVSRSWTQLSD